MAADAANHCPEQYYSGDLVSPSAADRSLHTPPKAATTGHGSSGWGKAPLGVSLQGERIGVVDEADYSTPVFSMVFSLDDNTLATAGTNEEIDLWDVDSGQRQSSIMGLLDIKPSKVLGG